MSGKFLGLAIVLLISTMILGLAAAVSMYYVLWQFPAFVPVNFTWTTYWMALTCQWFSLVTVLSVSVFCFSIASHPFIAILLSVLIYLAGQNMELLRKVVVENPYAGILSGKEGFVTAVSWVLPNLSLFDKKYVAAYGLAFSPYEFILMLLYCLSYSALMLFLSTIIFSRKELA